MRSIALLSLLGLSTPALAVPATFTHQGSLSGPDGLPLTGVHAMTFRLYGEVSGGSPVWMGTYAPRFVAGVYAVEIGGAGTTPIDSALLSAYPLWLELEVDGVVLSPRQPLTSVPYASVAGVAERVEGGAVDATGLSVNGVEVVDADGRWVGEAPATTWSSVSDVPAELLDGDADTLAGISCADGSVLTVVAGTWACGSTLDAAAVGALVDARNLATQADLDALALTCDGLSGEVGDLDGRVTVLEDGSLALSGDVSALTGRVGTLETGVTSVTGRVSTLESGATSLRGRVTALETLGDADTLAGLSCADGELAAWDATLGEWACAADRVLTEAEVDAYVADNGYASGSSVTSLTGRVSTLETGASALGGRVSTLESRTDADTLAGLSCADGELAAWDATLGEWACVADRVLTEAEVDAYVADNGYASGSSVTSLTGRVSTLETGASALGGRVSTLESASSSADADITALQGDVSDLQADVATDAVTLTSLLTSVASLGTRVTTLEATVAGLVATSFSGSFLDLDDVPAGLADGDDDTLGDLSCADGEVAQFDAATASWVCGEGDAARRHWSKVELYGNPMADALSACGLTPTGGLYCTKGWMREIPVNGVVDFAGGTGDTLAWIDSSALHSVRNGQSYSVFGSYSSVVNIGDVCAVSSGGVAMCWDALGSRRAASVSSVIDLVSGWNYACALQGGGGVSCWSSGGSAITGPPGLFSHIYGSAEGPYFCGSRPTGGGACWTGGSTTVAYTFAQEFVDMIVGNGWAIGVTSSGALQRIWLSGSPWSYSDVSDAVAVVGSRNNDDFCVIKSSGGVMCLGAFEGVVRQLDAM